MHSHYTIFHKDQVNFAQPLLYLIENGIFLNFNLTTLMVIGLKCYSGLAISFGILTFSLNLLVSEILRIFIKILSESEAHNAYKLYAYKSVLSLWFIIFAIPL